MQGIAAARLLRASAAAVLLWKAVAVTIWSSIVAVALGVIGLAALAGTQTLTGAGGGSAASTGGLLLGLLGMVLPMTLLRLVSVMTRLVLMEGV
jgi:hypothetical protein